VGLVVSFPSWLLGWISDRGMIGLTLALSWLALVFEARNEVHLAKRHRSAGS